MEGLDRVTPRPGPLDRMLRSVEPKSLAIVLFGAIAIVGTLGAVQAAQGPVEAEVAPYPHGFLGFFYLDGEYNLPAIFSGVLWLLAAATLAAAGRVLENGARRWFWTALGVALVYLAFDETFGLHEKLEGRTGIDWQLLYLPLFLAIAVDGLYVLVQSRGAARVLLLLAGVAAFTAQVLEAAQWDGNDAIDAYRLLMVPEEILEPTAAALIAVAGLILYRAAALSP
jgi:hypothetical protein